MARTEVDYGQDAPGIRLAMFAIAAAGTGLSFASWVASARRRSEPSRLLLAVRVLGVVALLYGAWMGSYMTWSSRIGKQRTRDNLLERIGRLRSWRGDEVVLDVGCGRGLMLIGAAKKLDRGKAVGVDIWRAEDQSANTPEAALENARREGVAERVTIATGDARNLPFENESVDVVLSHWVVHNIEFEPDRQRAIDEMWRVLRPGGVIAIADIEHVSAYRAQLATLGASPYEFLDGGWEARIMGALSGGTFTPQALLCMKPGRDES